MWKNRGQYSKAPGKGTAVHQDWEPQGAMPVQRLLLASGGVLLLMGCAGVLPLWLAIPLGVYVLWPVWGFLGYALGLAAAIALDPLRLQPQFLSLLLLLPLGFLPQSGIILARMHLATLWLFAGLWKLSSAGYYEAHLLEWSLGLTLWRPWGNAAAALLEASLGFAALVQVWRPHRSRWLVGFGGLFLHAGILAVLVSVNWNRAVWVWNTLLALESVFIFDTFAHLVQAFRGRMAAMPGGFGRSTNQVPREQTNFAWRHQPAATRTLCVFLLIYPLTYHLGLADPYGSHNLYSRSTPFAERCSGPAAAPERCRPFAPSLAPSSGVPLPPLPGLLAEAFARDCAPGERLRVFDPRLVARLRGRQEQSLLCPRRESLTGH